MRKKINTQLNTKEANQIGVRAQSAFVDKSLLALRSELFPRGSAQCMLKVGDTFIVGVSKQVAKDAIVSNSQLTTVIPIRDMNQFDSVRENG